MNLIYSLYSYVIMIIFCINAIGFTKSELFDIGFANIKDTFTTYKYKCIIVANSPNELTKKEIIYLQSQKHIANIIALDGMGCRLLKAGIKPDFILGDFDSIPWEKLELYFSNKWIMKLPNHKNKIYIELPYISYGKEKIYIVPSYNQNYNDLDKALGFIYVMSDKKANIEVLHATGGRGDHNLSSYGLIAKRSNKHFSIKLIQGKESVSQFVEFFDSKGRTIVLDIFVNIHPAF